MALDCLPLTGMSVPRGHLVNKLDSHAAANAYLLSTKERTYILLMVILQEFIFVVWMLNVKLIM